MTGTCMTLHYEKGFEECGGNKPDFSTRLPKQAIPDRSKSIQVAKNDELQIIIFK